MISGHIADRINIRWFLVSSYAMITVATVLLGMFNFWGVKNYYAYVGIEILEGIG